MPSVKDTRQLWKVIDERLSSSEAQTCKSLLEDLKSHRIGRNQVHKSLRRLFKKDEYLHQRFRQLFPYNGYDQDGKTQEDTDIEKGEIRDEETEREKKRSRKETIPSLKNAIDLWKIIDQRLSSSEVKTCKSLLDDLLSNRREGNQVHASLGRMFKKDKYLHQRFTQLFPYSDFRDDHPKIDNQAVAMPTMRLGLRICRRVSETALNQKSILMKVDTSGGKILTGQEDTDKIREEDQYQAVAIANHEIRVTNVPPCYRLLTMPKEEEKSERALTGGGKILTGREKIMAKCEDEMYEAYLLIETLTSTIRSVEKVMSGEMRMEHLGASFYRCVKELLGRRDTVNEIELPGFLTLLKEKLDKLIVVRESKKSGWKKVLQRQRKK